MTTVKNEFSIDGFSIGHWTHKSGATGCTVLLADELSPAAVDVRGGAPGTRETALLDGSCMARRLDAVLLTGGSAFGLCAADGIMEWLRENKRGVSTPAMPIPLVGGAVIYDLTAPDPIWPSQQSGYQAANEAQSEWRSGRFGAGAGATVSKALGRDKFIRAGMGVSRVDTPSGSVAAVLVVNALGDIYDDRTGETLTTPGGQGRTSEEIFLSQEFHVGFGENTVIGAIACDRPLNHHVLTRMTYSAHSGLARVVRPSHTPNDGDTIFALANGHGDVSHSEMIQLTGAAQLATARAIINSIR